MIKTPYRYLSDDDLSETQIYVTMQTYDRCAPEYAQKWEWNPITVREIKKYNIAPFQKYVKLGSSVLLVECQSGRDYKLLSELGYSCFGVGSSYGLLVEATKRVPNGLFGRLDPRELPFIPESFDGIYADALTNIPRRDLPSVLADFHIFLKTKGILYLSLKLGSKHVLELSDLGGQRFFSLYQKSEITTMLSKAGFTLLWSDESFNTDHSLPHWFSVVVQKKA